MQKTPRICSVSLKHSSAGARNFPRLCIISSSSAHEEWPRGNVTFLEMLACLEQALVATWSTDACISVLQEVFGRANGNKTPPWAGGPAGGEVKSWN